MDARSERAHTQDPAQKARLRPGPACSGVALGSPLNGGVHLLMHQCEVFICLCISVMLYNTSQSYNTIPDTIQIARKNSLRSVTMANDAKLGGRVGSCRNGAERPPVTVVTAVCNDCNGRLVLGGMGVLKLYYEIEIEMCGISIPQSYNTSQCIHLVVIL